MHILEYRERRAIYHCTQGLYSPSTDINPLCFIYGAQFPGKKMILPQDTNSRLLVGELIDKVSSSIGNIEQSLCIIYDKNAEIDR